MELLSRSIIYALYITVILLKNIIPLRIFTMLHLLECLLINCNLCWNRCFSVTCWISIKPFTISNIVSFKRAFARPESSSHGTRCWYFLQEKI